MAVGGGMLADMKDALKSIFRGGWAVSGVIAQELACRRYAERCSGFAALSEISAGMKEVDR
jgi:hypothetical protein